MNETVAVASGTRRTGKTTSVGALGTILADAGHDVLLVDCDVEAPSLAASLGIEGPDATVQDAIAGRATRQEAIETSSSGVSVVTGGSEPATTTERLAAFVDDCDSFDIVVCDTGEPFSEMTSEVLSVADGVVVVSTPDDAAKQNTATLHESLRESENASLLGTVLTRVDEAAATESWDCEVLASIPDSNAVASGASLVLDAPRDPAARAYRDLAGDVIERLRGEPGSVPADQRLWLSPPSDPFITADAAVLDTDDESGGSSAKAENESSETPVKAENKSDERAEASTADAANDRRTDTPASESGGESDDDEAGGFAISRRGALAAITAAIGGVSAGIVTTSETPEIEAFGYGGRPVSTTDSGAANATNTTTDAGSISAGGVNRTEQTTELVDGGSDEDPTPNETETGGVDNTTDSGNVTNATDPENTNTTDSGNVTDTTGSSEELTPTQDSDDGSSTDTDGSSPTNGGSTGTGDGTTTDDGSGNETGTDDRSGGDDTTDETSPSEPSDEFGTVGYGQGGYGGVA